MLDNDTSTNVCNDIDWLFAWRSGYTSQNSRFLQDATVMAFKGIETAVWLVRRRNQTADDQLISSRISCGSHTQSWRTIIQQNIYTCSEQCHLAETPAEVTRYDGTGICTFRGLLCAPLRQNSWTTIFARCCPGWRTPPGLNDRTLAGLRGTQLNVKTNDVMVPILRDGVQTLQMGYNLLVHQDLHLHDVEGVWIRWQGKTSS